MKRIIAGVSAIALSLSVVPGAFVEDTFAANQQQTINLQVEVIDTLSMDCFDLDGGVGDTTVLLDSSAGEGMVTAGNPAVGSSRCNVITNDDQGYYLTIEKTTEGVTWADAGGVGEGVAAGVSTVMVHEDPNADGTWYGIPDKTAYSYATPNVATWSGVGLGFSVIAFPDATTANNDFYTGGAANWVTGAGTCVSGVGADAALYAGVPETAEAIAAVPEYAAATTTTDVCYKVDVPTTQESGVYGGQVTFTATSDASAYLN